MQNATNLHVPLRGLGTLLLLALVPACGSGDSAGGFQAPRETSSTSNGGGMGSGAGNGMPSAANPGSIPMGGAPVDMESDTPPGWSKVPNTSMRALNFRVGGNEKAECYLALLGGDSGGLASNIDRWRSQIGLAPLGPGELEKLEHVQMLGRDGVVVDFAGTWKGMGGTENNANWRLVGVLQVDVAGSAFLKMFGPDALIAVEKEHFLALAKSIRPSHAGFTQGAAPTQAPAPMPTETNPPAPAMDPNNPAVASMAGQQGGFNWMAPGSWNKGAEKPTRAVTYQTSGGAECYVTVIGGDAGGVGANVNRWRDQMGCAGLPAEEIEKLEKLSILGTEGRMVAIEGAGAKAGQEMLGAMAIVGGRSVFVKMTGPKDAVQKEAENFKAFAQSLKEAK